MEQIWENVLANKMKNRETITHKYTCRFIFCASLLASPAVVHHSLNYLLFFFFFSWTMRPVSIFLVPFVFLCSNALCPFSIFLVPCVHSFSIFLIPCACFPFNLKKKNSTLRLFSIVVPCVCFLFFSGTLHLFSIVLVPGVCCPLF